MSVSKYDEFLKNLTTDPKLYVGQPRGVVCQALCTADIHYTRIQEATHEAFSGLMFTPLIIGAVGAMCAITFGAITAAIHDNVLKIVSGAFGGVALVSLIVILVGGFVSHQNRNQTFTDTNLEELRADIAKQLEGWQEQVTSRREAAEKKIEELKQQMEEADKRTKEFDKIVRALSKEVELPNK